MHNWLEIPLGNGILSESDRISWFSTDVDDDVDDGDDVNVDDDDGDNVDVDDDDDGGGGGKWDQIRNSK